MRREAVAAHEKRIQDRFELIETERRAAQVRAHMYSIYVDIDIYKDIYVYRIKNVSRTDLS